MNFLKGLSGAIILFVSMAVGWAQQTIAPSEAASHVGKEMTVCGKAVDTNYVPGSRGQPTFINLDEAYPDHIFTIVIWGENRWRFDHLPEIALRGKRICVTGEIETYRGKPQIEVTYPEQIEFEEGGSMGFWK